MTTLNMNSNKDEIVCPNCKTINDKNYAKCVSCGADISALNKYEETQDIFANGLPEWDIEPPHMMVRRR